MNRANQSGITRALGALRLTSRSSSQSAAEDADIVPPFRIHRTATSVLEAMASTIRRSPGYHPDIHPNDPLFFKNARPALFNHTLEYKLKGRQSARYIINNSIAGDIVPLRTEQPRIHAFDPRITSSQVAEMTPSEETLGILIAMGNASSAWQMYNELGAETVSSETRLKLFDLLCANNSRSRNLTEIDQIEIFIERKQPIVSIPTRPIQKQKFPSWAFEGHAEEMFKTLSEEEKGMAGYKAMIRGMARYGAYEQALKLHREMIKGGFAGDLKSYNAVLMCVHTVTPFTWKRGKETMTFHPWRAGLDLFYEMRDSGIVPDVESFNSLIFSIAFSVHLAKTKAGPACKSVISLLKEMEALDIPPNLGTLTNILRLADHVADIVAGGPKASIEASSLGRDRIFSQTHDKIKAAMSEILDYIVEEMSKDKGRKRFGNESDMEILLLLKNARFVHNRPAEIAVKLHYLLRDSPGIAIRHNKRNMYLTELLSYLSKHDLQSAVDILDEEVNYVVHFRTPEKIRYIDAYAKARPERMHNFLKAMVHQTKIQEDFVSFRLLFITLYYVSDSYPFCRSSVIEALEALWTRVSRDWQTFAILNESFYSNFLFLLLPTDVSSEVEASALDLGVTVFNTFKNNGAIFSSAHRVLHLAHALLKAGRSAEGLTILETIVAKKCTVFEDAKDQFDSLIDKIAEFPEVMANEQLSTELAEHKESKSLYVVSKKSESLVDKKIIEKALNEEEEEQSFRPFRRKFDGTSDQRFSGKVRMPMRKGSEKERTDVKGGYSRRREFREFTKKKHHFGFPSEKNTRKNRTTMLPKLETNVAMKEIGNEENWPSPIEDDTSSSSSSSSDEE